MSAPCAGVRVVLIDVPLMVGGLVPVFTGWSAGQLVGTASSVGEGVAIARCARATVLVVGECLAGRRIEDAEAVLAQVAELDVPVVVLAHSPTAMSAVRWLDAGARGYVGVAAGTEMLHSSCVHAHRGGTMVDESIVAELALLRAPGAACFGGVSELTRRQRDVVDAIASGCDSVAEIAVELNVAPRTVRDHLSELHTRFDVSDRAGLLRNLWGLGLLFPPSDSEEVAVA